MILYLGDGNIHGAAAYLCGILRHHGIPFERVDSDATPKSFSGYDAYILSDYPAVNFKPEQWEEIRHAVAAGSGLVMFGGWESFHGRLGEYHRTPLAEILPVEISDSDDRRNFAQPLMVHRRRNHPMLNGLPWDKPPFIGGFNAFKAKPGTETLLEAVRFDIRLVDEGNVADCDEKGVCDIDGKPIDERTSIPLWTGETLFLSLPKRYPLLVVGRFGEGNVAALATDVAPHWVGGWVDWGKERIVQKNVGDEFVEIGADYARFFAQLIRWAGNDPNAAV